MTEGGYRRSEEGGGNRGVMRVKKDLRAEVLDRRAFVNSDSNLASKSTATKPWLVTRKSPTNIILAHKFREQ